MYHTLKLSGHSKKCLYRSGIQATPTIKERRNLRGSLANTSILVADKIHLRNVLVKITYVCNITNSSPCSDYRYRVKIHNYICPYMIEKQNTLVFLPLSRSSNADQPNWKVYWRIVLCVMGSLSCPLHRTTITLSPAMRYLSGNRKSLAWIPGSPVAITIFWWTQQANQGAASKVASLCGDIWLLPQLQIEEGSLLPFRLKQNIWTLATSIVAKIWLLQRIYLGVSEILLAFPRMKSKQQF